MCVYVAIRLSNSLIMICARKMSLGSLGVVGSAYFIMVLEQKMQEL